MKKLLLFIFFLVSLTAIGQKIEPKPNPPRLVNDFAGILSSSQKDSLESKLVAYDDSTSTQIAVIIVKSVGDYDVQQVALKYLRDWGIGNKNNNGVVVLASIDDRKIRIETGYGMEGVLPDIIAKQIIDNEITPNFRTGNYYTGFDQGTNAIIKAAAGEYKAPAGYNKKSKGRSGGPAGFFILIFIVLIISFMSRGGGRGGGMMSRRGFSPWIIGSMLGGMGSGGGGGGGWSGGGGGGGFGGFGGGSGGGGGASGSW